MPRKGSKSTLSILTVKNKNKKKKSLRQNERHFLHSGAFWSARTFWSPPAVVSCCGFCSVDTLRSVPIQSPFKMVILLTADDNWSFFVSGFTVSASDWCCQHWIYWLVSGEECVLEALFFQEAAIWMDTKHNWQCFILTNMTHLYLISFIRKKKKKKRTGKVTSPHTESGFCRSFHAQAHQALNLNSWSLCALPKLSRICCHAVTPNTEKLLKPDFSVCFLH